MLLHNSKIHPEGNSTHDEPPQQFGDCSRSLKTTTHSSVHHILCGREYAMAEQVYSVYTTLASRSLYIHLYVYSGNKGHVGTRSFVLYREVSFIQRLKCTGIIGIGTSRFVLYREVSFIQSVLYWRFHCIYYVVKEEHAWINLYIATPKNILHATAILNIPRGISNCSLWVTLSSPSLYMEQSGGGGG